jgi:hypothetical protein
VGVSVPPADAVFVFAARHCIPVVSVNDILAWAAAREGRLALAIPAPFAGDAPLRRSPVGLPLEGAAIRWLVVEDLRDGFSPLQQVHLNHCLCTPVAEMCIAGHSPSAFLALCSFADFSFLVPCLALYCCRRL